MPLLWSGIRDDIERLEKARGSYSEWVSLSDGHTILHNSDSVREALKSTRLSDDEVTQVALVSAKGIRTVHFGFEGNFHALVTFGKDDRSTQVVKW